jgi:hypothetical protein
MKKVIDILTYDGESIIDIQEQIYYAIEDTELPKDEYGFFKGTITVTIEWSDE